MPNLLGLHDPGGESWMAGDPGWIVHTVALSSEGPCDYRQWSERGFVNIVRLNWGYGSTGTIPLPSGYEDFARRVANFVAASPGCWRWIIGNEPNHSQERPQGQPILPDMYADCYRQCRTAIHQVQPEAQVLVAAIAPWNVETGDWLQYLAEALLTVESSGVDAIALHTYTHGSDPALIVSTATMDPPYEDRYFHFLAYQDLLSVVPESLRHLPVYLTETDQDVPWTDANDGWIQMAVMEIDSWNRQPDTQKIMCLCCYRWSGDQWALEGKQARLADFAAALALGIQSPSGTGDSGPGPGGVPGGPEEPESPVIGQPSPVTIDPALLARGVRFEWARVPAGTGYWRMRAAYWLDETQADAVGPDHHILGTVTRDGIERPGIPLLVRWPSGETIITSKSHSPNATYNYDYPMSPSLNEFSLRVSDGNASDLVSGIGMGKDGNPAAHTSTWIEWEWTIAGEPPEPIPPEPERTKLIWPVDGPITQYFGSHGISYPGEAGHDGIDYGVPMGTPVRAVADGIVKWVDNDAAGFGLYIRIYYPAYGFHGLVAHLSEQHVRAGDSVKQGQIVGLSGNTGNSTGPHCHYSTRLGDEESYYELHDGYEQGATNPLAVYALVNGSDPNDDW